MRDYRRRFPGCELHYLIGGDLVVTASSDALAKMAVGTTHGVVNCFETPTSEFTRNPDWQFPLEKMQAAIVEAALASFLSPDSSERMEAAFSRRLDRISRQLDKLDYHVEVGNEAIALFVRTWLISNPALPDSQLPAAQAQAQERFAAFVSALARRMESEQRLAR